MQPHALLVAAFVSAAALPLSSGTPDADATTKSSGMCLRYKTGFDIIGHDYYSAPANNAVDCRAMCTNRDECWAYTYSWDNNTCYLKSDLAMAAYKPHVTSGVWLDKNGKKACPRLHFLVENCDLRGHDVSNFAAADANDCLPTARDKELSFTWSDDNGGTCWLKTFAETEFVECIPADNRRSGIYGIETDW